MKEQEKNIRQHDLSIAIGCDPAGFALKTFVVQYLKKSGYHNVIDVGCESVDEGFFAPVGKKVADLVGSGEYHRGILLCGTGQGMAMVANKVRGVRAALVFDIFPAVLSREHNNSNILCTGGWMIDEDKAVKMIEAWLFAGYNGLYDEGMELMAQYEEGR